MIEFVLVPLILAGLAVNGLRLRARVPPALPAGCDDRDGVVITSRATTPEDSSVTSRAATPGEMTWIASRGTRPDEETRRDAIAYAWELLTSPDWFGLDPAKPTCQRRPPATWCAG